ncbi:hypothetical protein, partial [Rhodoplanes serenus]|uniref:hypothetical protein n=1 Tax=Rhodoplanes serenus TaxID=200615 RepID=UPI001AECBF2F
MRPSRFVATLAGLAAVAALWHSGLALAQQGGAPAAGNAPAASPPAASPPAASPPAASPPAASAAA